MKEYNKKNGAHCTIRLNRTIPLMLAISMGTLPAHAQSSQSSPTLETSFKYNDNLFLLSDEESPIDTIGDNSTSDLISQITLGYITEASKHRQNYELDISAFHREYDKFDRLQFTGGNIKAKWDWFFNKQWDGKLSYRFKKDQSNFGDQRLPEGDSYDWHQLNAVINRRLSKKSKLYALLGYKQKEYKERFTLDNDLSQAGLGYEYLSRTGNTIAIEVSNGNGEYKNRADAFLPDQSLREYDQNRIELKTKWFPSNKSELRLYAGYIEREHNTELSQFDFDGGVFHFSYEWSLSNKTTLSFLAKRDLVDTENTRSLYTEQDNISAEFDWRPTNKLSFSGSIGRRDIDFTQIEGTRNDSIDFIALGANYQWYPNIDLDLTLENQNRDSSEQLNQYDNQLIIFTITYSQIK